MPKVVDEQMRELTRRRILRVAVNTSLLEQSQAHGELRCPNVEATALMALSLTESYVLSAKVLGQSEQEITRQAGPIAQLILQGIGAAAQ
jgi:hypothetical protein